MFRIIKQKIKNKKWLTICLTLGITFLVAVFTCQPMFKAGALNMDLRKSFDDYAEANNEYPAVIGAEGVRNCEKNSLNDILTKLDGYDKTWLKYIDDVGVVSSQTFVSISRESAAGSYGNKGNYLSISYIPELEKHVSLIDGSFYNDAAVAAEGTDEASLKKVEEAIKAGCYPCVMTRNVMDDFGLVVGETLDFSLWQNAEGESLKLVVAGIFKEADAYDTFWHLQPNSFEINVFVAKDDLNAILADYEVEKINYNHYIMLDYEDISSANIEDIGYYLDRFDELDKTFVTNFHDIADSYKSKKKTIGTLLWVLQLPVFGMVLAFIYMVSAQIAESEKKEIAMQRSRGLSRFQIILGYAMECGILAVAGSAIGLGLGYLLCKLSASTTDFLTFDGSSAYLYTFTPEMLLYALVACVVGMFFMLLPVVAYSKISIVEHNSMKQAGAKPLWERLFLDIILLGVSLYLLRNFNVQKDSIRLDVINGSKMDPVIFLDSTLFIIGFGMLVLRLSHYLVKLIYRIGKNRWSPAMYASFLQITRTFSRQGFISVFMILTVAMGLFNANTARTINQNYEDRIEYAAGADYVVKEPWVMNVFKNAANEFDYKYIEPDYERFSVLIEKGIAKNITKVIRFDDTTVGSSSKSVTVTLLGINTKEFGMTANYKEELNKDEHWFTSLNELSKKPDGIIISENFARDFDLKVGDKINVSKKGDTDKFKDKPRGTMNSVVCAIVSDWPGYERYYYEEGEEKQRYLIVANYPSVVSAFQIAPYYVWMSLCDGVTSEDVKNAFAEAGIDPREHTSVAEDVEAMKQEPLIQITNGIFTLSFIIALVLCALGFLIYWISSIRQREHLFGVYRAMGLSVRNLNRMLTNEHIFSTFLSVIAGGVVGMVSTILYVGLFGIVYLPKKHNLDIYIYYHAADIIKLAATVTLMILVCMLILRKIIKSTNITQALKLGEE